jgi:O-antigen biosynthesis protein
LSNRETEIAFWYGAARAAGVLRPRRRAIHPIPPRETLPGISVVIPSRNGRDLLAAQLPEIERQLRHLPSELIVVDNGSSDGTAGWLGAEWPQAKVEVSPGPLSFARAVNRGIARARCSHVCLLNNDMLIERGFFEALRAAFDRIPGLFCSTAQIFFPEGVRREETGKAVYAQPEPADFPIRCDVPLDGEDLTWVLYGSGGCSLYDAAKLRALGGIDEAFEPVYVEDLDIGYRAWQRGWATVYAAGARLEHRHRATSSRYYTAAELDAILEVNYLKFLARAVSAQPVFARLWDQALRRLRLRAARFPAAHRALRAAHSIALAGGGPEGVEYSEDGLLALTGGDVAVLPGSGPMARVRTLCAAASPEAVLPGTIVVVFTERLEPPPSAALGASVEMVLVRRPAGTAAFRAALEQALRKWRPEVVRLGPGMEEFASERYTPAGAAARWTWPGSPYQVTW